MENHLEFNKLIAELVRESSNPEHLKINETKNRLRIRNEGLKYFDRLIYLVKPKSRPDRSERDDRLSEILHESNRIAARTSLTPEQVHSIFYHALRDFL